MDKIEDDLPNDPLDLVIQYDLSLHVESWLSGLSHRHRDVVARRFGLLGYSPSTLEEVGRAVGLTRERVRQLQIEALDRLKRIIQSDAQPEDN